MSTARRRDYMSAYMARYRCAGKDRSRRTHANLSRPFVGVDGEGGNLSTGYHSYFLLTAGDVKLLPREGEVRLSTRDCLRFLASLPTDSIYVAFFFDYDVTKICEDLPWAKLDRLAHREKRVLRSGKGGPLPVDYEGFQLDYVPHKEFRVRRRIQCPDRCGHCDDDRLYSDPRCPHIRPPDTYSPWVVINDVGSFFQTSFVNAIEKWNVGTPALRDRIAAGKVLRGQFRYEEIDDIAEYNALEIALLQELMEKFRATCESTGYVPSAWQGPGLLAEAMLRAHAVPRSRDVPLLQVPEYESLREFAANAFYGGRPEISCIGSVAQPVWQWDINSAYPYAMQFVPCLIHGRWERKRDIDYQAYDRPTGRVGEKYALLFGEFTVRSDEHSLRPGRPLFYGLPFRDESGTILYPAAGQGWYWSFEASGSIHQSILVSDAWEYTRTCRCAPLGFVTGVYLQRLSVGKDDAGIVLKLGLNSLYGKTVQSIGAPKYANPIWGSFITAYCRTMIQDFIHSSPACQAGYCGWDVQMIATDSVMTTTERTDIEPGNALGGWSVERHGDGVFLIQPGLYFGSSGKRAKTRGVPLASVTAQEQEFRDAYFRMAASGRLEDGDVVVPQRIFAGIRYALHRRNTKLLGQWISFDEEGRGGKVIRFDWHSKRAEFPVLAPLPGVREHITTFPQTGSTDLVTTPYSRDIGGLQYRETERLAFESMPEWAPQLGEL